MKLPADTIWLRDAKGQALLAALEGAGHRVLFVGGCVRNAVLNAPASDVDISTDALPEQVMEVAAQAGFHSVPTGIDHGTVTVVVQGAPFEVTTFRRDVETDGRRAVVAFSDRIEDDARRRDFTMNALYAARDGTVVDPLKGLDDALAGRVRFIEDAGQRIREDYLRILRFFRFSAYYSNPDNGFDAETLAAIAAHLDGLDHLSAERVGAEMLKLLAAPDPGPAVAVMDQTGVLPRIMPVPSLQALGPLIALEQGTDTPPEAIRRLASLNPEDAASKLRLSKKDAKALSDLRESRDGTLRARALGHELGATRGWDALLLRHAGLGTMPEDGSKQAVQEGADMEFPIRASDLQPEVTGPALGRALAEMKARWLASDLTLDRAALLG